MKKKLSTFEILIKSYFISRKTVYRVITSVDTKKLTKIY